MVGEIVNLRNRDVENPRKVTMDIYAKVKYNKPWELATVVNTAFKSIQDTGENSANLMG